MSGHDGWGFQPEPGRTTCDMGHPIRPDGSHTDGRDRRKHEHSTEDFDLRQRSLAVQELMEFFSYGHLPAGKPREVSAHCAGLAIEMVRDLNDGMQLEMGLFALLQAKDCLVRQAVLDGRS